MFDCSPFLLLDDVLSFWVFIPKSAFRNAIVII
jgi:hypothetical protein